MTLKLQDVGEYSREEKCNGRGKENRVYSERIQPGPRGRNNILSSSLSFPPSFFYFFNKYLLSSS